MAVEHGENALHPSPVEHPLFDWRAGRQLLLHGEIGVGGIKAYLLHQCSFDEGLFVVGQGRRIVVWLVAAHHDLRRLLGGLAGDELIEGVAVVRKMNLLVGDRPFESQLLEAALPVLDPRGLELDRIAALLGTAMNQYEITHDVPPVGKDGS